MSSNGLPVDRVVKVDVNLSPTLAQFPNLNTCLLLGTSAVIDTVTRMREYSSSAEVAADFGTLAEEFLGAVAWFSQKPQPTSLLIGRWAKTASSGQLIGGQVSAANQLISAWTAIVAGSIRFTIDGGAPQNLAALNFGAVTNLNAVATIITTALAGTAVVKWNPTFQRFEVTSATAGAASSVAFCLPTGAGVDISAMLALRATSSGAYLAPGLAAETALAAVTLLDSMFSSQFYGLVIPSAVDADHLAVAAYVESANPPHYYGVTTQEAGVLVSSDTSDIAFELANSDFDKTATQYSSTSNFAITSLLARILTTNWNASKSTITLKFKTEPGIGPELLTTNEADSISAKNCNVLAGYNNASAIIQEGVSASGVFIDEVIGIDWLRGVIQTNQFNVMVTLPKVAQTDGGMHLLATAAEAALKLGVNNGLLAPGVWNAGGFGQLSTGDFLPKGYYIFQPPIASQAQADRAARKSVPFQIAAKTAGGVHVVFNILNVNA
jgi:uncharacterized protein DUF3383